MSGKLAVVRPSDRDYDFGGIEKEHGANAVEPLIPGVVVQTEMLWGCLSAMFDIAEELGDIDPLVRLTLDENNLTLEYICDQVWAHVRLPATGPKTEFVSAAVPLVRAKGVATALACRYRTIEVGLDEESVGFGPLSIPYGCLPDDFPPPPVVKDMESRVTMPSFYIKEVRHRIVVARQERPTISSGGSVGVAIDFEPYRSKDGTSWQPVFVATDSHRMHIWRPTQAVTSSTDKPPAVSVPSLVFSYLHAINDRDIIRMEIAENQVAFYGEDYFLITPAHMLGMLKVKAWTSVEPKYRGGWVIDRRQMVQAVSTIEAARPEYGESEVLITIDEQFGDVHLGMWSDSGGMYKESINAGNENGSGLSRPLHVDVRYLKQALDSCRNNIVRLEVDEPHEEQHLSALVVADGNDFRAVIMPRKTND